MKLSELKKGRYYYLEGQQWWYKRDCIIKNILKGLVKYLGDECFEFCKKIKEGHSGIKKKGKKGHCWYFNNEGIIKLRKLTKKEFRKLAIDEL